MSLVGYPTVGLRGGYDRGDATQAYKKSQFFGEGIMLSGHTRRASTLQPGTNVADCAMPQSSNSTDLVACKTCVIRVTPRALLKRSSKLDPRKDIPIILVFQDSNCFADELRLG